METLIGPLSQNPPPRNRLSHTFLRNSRMPEDLKQSRNPWMDTAEVSSRAAEFNKDVSLMSESVVIVDGLEAPKASENQRHHLDVSSGGQLGFTERSLSAAGAAFLSAILVNPLDVVKTRLQAQAAGVHYSHPLSNLTSRMAYFGPAHDVC